MTEVFEDPGLSAGAMRYARRVPRQDRSRRRVELLLDAASGLVLSEGVDALTTRAIAESAQVPVASLYQYFADIEDVLLALVERDLLEMDLQLLSDLATIETLTLPVLVETSMRSFAKVYSRCPAFVEIWLRGRTNPAIRERGRVHSAEVAISVVQFAEASGILARDMPAKIALLAVEVGDRVLQVAYATDFAGDQELIEEGISMVTAYLEPYSRQP